MEQEAEWEKHYGTVQDRTAIAGRHLIRHRRRLREAGYEVSEEAVKNLKHRTNFISNLGAGALKLRQREVLVKETQHGHSDGESHSSNSFDSDDDEEFDPNDPFHGDWSPASFTDSTQVESAVDTLIQSIEASPSVKKRRLATAMLQRLWDYHEAAKAQLDVAILGLVEKGLMFTAGKRRKQEALHLTTFIADFSPWVTIKLAQVGTVLKAARILANKYTLAARFLQLIWRSRHFERKLASSHPPEVRNRQKLVFSMSIREVRSIFFEDTNWKQHGKQRPEVQSLTFEEQYSLVKLLGTLASKQFNPQFAKDRTRMVGEGVVPCLLQLVTHESSALRKLAADVLLALAMDDNGLRMDILRYGALRTVAVVLRSPYVSDRLSALDLTDQLANAVTPNNLSQTSRFSVWCEKLSKPASVLEPGVLDNPKVKRNSPVYLIQRDPVETMNEAVRYFLAPVSVDTNDTNSQMYTLLPLLVELLRGGDSTVKLGACMVLNKLLASPVILVLLLSSHFRSKELTSTEVLLSSSSDKTTNCNDPDVDQNLSESIPKRTKLSGCEKTIHDLVAELERIIRESNPHDTPVLAMAATQVCWRLLELQPLRERLLDVGEFVSMTLNLSSEYRRFRVATLQLETREGVGKTQRSFIASNGHVPAAMPLIAANFLLARFLGNREDPAGNEEMNVMDTSTTELAKAKHGTACKSDENVANGQTANSTKVQQTGMGDDIKLHMSSPWPSPRNIDVSLSPARMLEALLDELLDLLQQHDVAKEWITQLHNCDLLEPLLLFCQTTIQDVLGRKKNTDEREDTRDEPDWNVIRLKHGQVSSLIVSLISHLPHSDSMIFRYPVVPRLVAILKEFQLGVDPSSILSNANPVDQLAVETQSVCCEALAKVIQLDLDREHQSGSFVVKSNTLPHVIQVLLIGSHGMQADDAGQFELGSSELQRCQLAVVHSVQLLGAIVPFRGIEEESLCDVVTAFTDGGVESNITSGREVDTRGCLPDPADSAVVTKMIQHVAATLITLLGKVVAQDKFYQGGKLLLENLCECVSRCCCTAKHSRTLIEAGASIVVMKAARWALNIGCLPAQVLSCLAALARCNGGRSYLLGSGLFASILSHVTEHREGESIPLVAWGGMGQLVLRMANFSQEKGGSTNRLLLESGVLQQLLNFIVDSARCNDPNKVRMTSMFYVLGAIAQLVQDQALIVPHIVDHNGLLKVLAGVFTEYSSISESTGEEPKDIVVSIAAKQSLRILIAVAAFPLQQFRDQVVELGIQDGLQFLGRNMRLQLSGTQRFSASTGELCRYLLTILRAPTISRTALHEDVDLLKGVVPASASTSVLFQYDGQKFEKHSGFSHANLIGKSNGLPNRSGTVPRMLTSEEAATRPKKPKGTGMKKVIATDNKLLATRPPGKSPKKKKTTNSMEHGNKSSLPMLPVLPKQSSESSCQVPSSEIVILDPTFGAPLQQF